MENGVGIREAACEHYKTAHAARSPQQNDEPDVPDAAQLGVEYAGETSKKAAVVEGVAHVGTGIQPSSTHQVSGRDTRTGDDDGVGAASPVPHCPFNAIPAATG